MFLWHLTQRTIQLNKHFKVFSDPPAREGGGNAYIKCCPIEISQSAILHSGAKPKCLKLCAARYQFNKYQERIQARRGNQQTNISI